MSNPIDHVLIPIAVSELKEGQEFLSPHNRFEVVEVKTRYGDVVTRSSACYVSEQRVYLKQPITAQVADAVMYGLEQEASCLGDGDELHAFTYDKGRVALSDRIPRPDIHEIYHRVVPLRIDNGLRNSVLELIRWIEHLENSTDLRVAYVLRNGLHPSITQEMLERGLHDIPADIAADVQRIGAIYDCNNTGVFVINKPKADS